MARTEAAIRLDTETPANIDRLEARAGDTIAANEALPPHVRIAEGWDGVTAIVQDDVNLVIKPREVPDGLLGFVDALQPSKLPLESRTVATSQARSAVAGFIAQLWPEPTLGRQLLCHDVSNMVELFADIAKTRRVRISVQGQAKAPQGTFQAVAEAMRLEILYRGPSLEWLPDGAADRELLDTQDNDLICDDPSAVRGLPRFSVALIKGERHSGNAGGGLVVRDPLVGKDQPRLAVRLDCG